MIGVLQELLDLMGTFYFFLFGHCATPLVLDYYSVKPIKTHIK